MENRETETEITEAEAAAMYSDLLAQAENGVKAAQAQIIDLANAKDGIFYKALKDYIKSKTQGAAK